MTKKYNYNFDPIYIDSPLKYYLLGVFMTDGCIHTMKKSKAVTISSKDKNWLSLIKDQICPELPVKYNRDHWTIYFGSTSLANYLVSLGCTPKKSLTLQFPDVPNPYLMDFLRGCVDGDGSLGIYQNGKYMKTGCYICSSSKDFVDKMHNILLQNNIKHSFTQTKMSVSNINGRKIYPKNPHYRISFASKTAFTFIKSIYYKNNPLAMPRKQNIANNIIDYYISKKG